MKEQMREGVFRKYYLYKLGRLKGFAIAFLVLNILSLAVFGGTCVRRNDGQIEGD